MLYVTPLFLHSVYSNTFICPYFLLIPQRLPTPTSFSSRSDSVVRCPNPVCPLPDLTPRMEPSWHNLSPGCLPSAPKEYLTPGWTDGTKNGHQTRTGPFAASGSSAEAELLRTTPTLNPAPAPTQPLISHFLLRCPHLLLLTERRHQDAPPHWMLSPPLHLTPFALVF